jgi:hypothetical protein
MFGVTELREKPHSKAEILWCFFFVDKILILVKLLEHESPPLMKRICEKMCDPFPLQSE